MKTQIGILLFLLAAVTLHAEYSVHVEQQGVRYIVYDTSWTKDTVEAEIIHADTSNPGTSKYLIGMRIYIVDSVAIMKMVFTPPVVVGRFAYRSSNYPWRWHLTPVGQRDTLAITDPIVYPDMADPKSPNWDSVAVATYPYWLISPRHETDTLSNLIWYKSLTPIKPPPPNPSHYHAIYDTLGIRYVIFNQNWTKDTVAAADTLKPEYNIGGRRYIVDKLWHVTIVYEPPIVIGQFAYRDKSNPNRWILTPSNRLDTLTMADSIIYPDMANPFSPTWDSLAVATWPIWVYSSRVDTVSFDTIYVSMLKENLQMPMAQYESMLNSLKQNGTLSVVIYLKKPDHALGGALNWERYIVDAQDTLLKELDGFDVHSVYRFASVPLLGMTVDLAAFHVLATSPLVVFVQDASGSNPSAVNNHQSQQLKAGLPYIGICTGRKIRCSFHTSGRARIAVFNVKGQMVKTIADRTFRRGTYTFSWSGTDDRNKLLSPGAYVVSVHAEGNAISQRFQLVR